MSAPLSVAPTNPVFPTRLFGDIEVPPAAMIDFAEGLPGFRLARKFVLLQAASERLRWLQSLDNANLAFLLVELAAVADPLPGSVEEAFAIVTLPARDEPATANLAAPVLIDSIGRMGQQVIRTDQILPTAAPFDLEAILRPR